MQASRAEKARLGIFLLAAAAAVGLTLFFLLGKKLVEKTVPYYSLFVESVTGLEPGSPIKQNGVDIGTVKSMSTDSGDITKTIVRFEVRKGVPIKTDMVAALGSYGITGMKYVEVTGGSYGAADIPPGGELPSSMSTLGRITLRADSIAYKIDRLLGNVIQITDDGNRNNLNRLVKTTTDLSLAMDSLIGEIQAVNPGPRLENILNNADLAMKDVRDKIHRTNIEGTVEEYRKAAKGMTELTVKLDVTVRRIQEDLAVSMSQMRDAMKNMNSFSRQIKENPSVLIRGEDKKERRR